MAQTGNFTIDLDDLQDLESKGFSKEQILGKQVKDREVVGESNYQQALTQLSAGIGYTPGFRIEDSFLVLALYREPKNRYDRNAIAVYAGPLVVGYVPKGEAAVLAPWVDQQGGACWAGGRLMSSPRASMIGVRYWLERVQPSSGE